MNFIPRLTIGILACLACIPALAAPNVILVMADDMGWAQTGYYNHPVLETPNLDAMAESGLRMDRFYSGSPHCSTTRATVITGRTNDRTGTFTVGGSINKQEKTLSAAFRNAGYTTAHFGKWHLNTLNAPNVDDPMPLSDPHNPGELGFDYWLSETNQFNLDPLLSRNGTPERIEGESSEILVDEALRFIGEAHKQDKPAFVMIWYASPHRTFEARDEDMKAFGDLSEASRAHHGEIVAMDKSIGALRQGLRDLGIADNTLVWFCSDNGGLPTFTVTNSAGKEYPGVNPDSTGHLRGFKSSLNEGGIRVPGIIEWPGHLEPRVSNFPASTLDMFPTLIEVAGLDPDDINAVHDGISLVPVFATEPARRSQPMGFRVSGQYAWLDNDYKLIYYIDYEQAFVDGEWNGELFASMTPVHELYNVVEDPSEQDNLMEKQPGIAARMQAELDAWNASVDRSVEGADYPEGRVLPSGREEAE